MNQETALSFLKSGANIFLTGAAGTGKTFVLNQYIHYLKSRKIAVAITASTGIAATHMNGQTIHSWSGMGVKDNLSYAQIDALKQRAYLRKKIEKVKVLIVDEVSMLHRKQLNLLNEILMSFKETSEPFGGIQLVVTGDFLQLPPVSRNQEPSSEKFAFMGNGWLDANFKICYLVQQYRTKDILLNILNGIREANISQNHIETIEDKIENSRYGSEDFFPRLYTHNSDVDAVNEKYLSELSGKPKKYTAFKKGNTNLAESIQSSMLAPKELSLKINARVMFVRNHQEGLYVNGTLGKLVGFSDDGWPIVEKEDEKEIIVKEEKWHIQDETGKELASVTQIPLRLAWAITVHKSQGMTLDRAVIDLSKTFEKGQGFVALSRLRSWEGLSLLGCNSIALELDALAIKADKRFAELSNRLEKNINSEELKVKAVHFIKKSGGITDEREIKKTQDKIAGKANKKQTTLVTLEMLDKGFSLNKIAEERGLKLLTIFGHLEKLHANGHKINPKIVSVNKKLESDFKSAYSSLKEEGNTLKTLKEKMKVYSYQDVSKARLSYLLNLGK